MRSKVDEQTSEANLLVKLKLAFEERFRYDDAGVPRVWKPTDDIDSLFKKAKDDVRIALRDQVETLTQRNADPRSHQHLLAHQTYRLQSYGVDTL